MRHALFIVVGLSLAGVAHGAETTTNASLLYMTDDIWRPLDTIAKRDAATDFMATFCGVPTMSAADLVTCLDDGGQGPMFERALTCVRRAP